MATGRQKEFKALSREMRRMGLELDLRTAIWERKIDQMNTKEIAVKYEMSQAKALRFLKEIASGKSRDKRFVYDEERQGVTISDGTVFTYGPVDIGGGSYTDGKSVKHYIWFCS